MFLFSLLLLGLCSGFLGTYVGLGSGLIFVSFLPLVTSLTPLETLQMSLFVIFSVNGINTCIFTYQKRVAWAWVSPVVSVGLVASFILSLTVTALSPFAIRLIFCLFLLFIILSFFFLRRYVFQKSFPYVSGFIMGSCSGLTGLGGGLILSPIFHESGRLPIYQVAPTICVITLITSFFALVGQFVGTQFLLLNSAYWWECFFILMASSLLGLILGHLLNKDKRESFRKKFVRVFVILSFCFVSGELVYKLFLH